MSYSPDKFVGREEEIELVLSKAKALKKGETLETRTVVFTGERGIGKSWLLAHLCHELEQLGGIAVFFLNLAEYGDFNSNSADYANPETSPALMMKVWKDMLGLPEAVGVTTAAEVVRDELMKEVELAREGQPLALLLDTVYESNENMLATLEDYLLASLAIDARALVVMAGRGHAYPWTIPEFKIFADFRSLLPFQEVGVTVEQLKQQGKAAVPRGEEIHSYSGGNPLVNYLLATSEDVASGLNGAIEEILGYLSDDRRRTVREYLEALCVLRAFDDARIPVMLSTYYGGEDRRWSFEDARQVREELVERGYADWEIELGGFVLDETISKLLRDYLQIAQRALWKNLQKSACQLYNKWKESYPGSQERWQKEIDYHIFQMQTVS
jgi:hypothetical protein